MDASNNFSSLRRDRSANGMRGLASEQPVL